MQPQWNTTQPENEPLPFVVRKVNLEDTIPTEISQTEKKKIMHMLSHRVSIKLELWKQRRKCRLLEGEIGRRWAKEEEMLAEDTRR